MRLHPPGSHPELHAAILPVLAARNSSAKWSLMDQGPMSFPSPTADHMKLLGLTLEPNRDTYEHVISLASANFPSLLETHVQERARGEGDRAPR